MVGVGVQVGGAALAGELWLDMNGDAGQVMLPLLPLLASPDPLHRSAALPPQPSS